MSQRERYRRAMGIMLIALTLLLCGSPQFRSLMTFPDHMLLPVASTQRLSLSLPLRAIVHAGGAAAASVPRTGTAPVGLEVATGSPISIAAMNQGTFTVDFRLFGLIPLRRLTVDVVPPIRVIPGGHSIGVLLKSRGVIVVGHGTVRDEVGQIHQPGRDAGLEVGDTIIAIDGVAVSGKEHAARLFDEAGRRGEEAVLAVRRRGEAREFRLRPILEQESRHWRVGVFIRDGAAGVGTLTFYEPVSGTYGALGHVIADSDTRDPIDVDQGHIVEAEVAAVQRGRRAAPGEKIGIFKNEDNWIGTIQKNTRFGIFGSLTAPVTNRFYADPVPIATAGQVREGPAEILTVVEGQALERYQVEILRVMEQPTADGKNMIIRVVDPRLLEKTGGIIQGMSGSPILQDGRMVGAVTHVFVNDPTRGYGVLIEWMLKESGVLVPNRSSGSGVELPGALFMSKAVGAIRQEMTGA